MTTLDAVAAEQEASAGSAISRAEDLRRLSNDELMGTFLASPAPASIKLVDGHPAGVGVAPIVLAGGRFERWLRGYSESDRFLWHGKSFESLSDDEGWGWNRFGVGPILGAFPFRTSIGPSEIDGQPAMILDFDVPKNPFWERLTRDELREVAPGVLFGPTGLRLGGGYRTLAWFAVDANRQTPLIGA